jgi:GT2 family glycosyltransferase
VDGKFLSVAGRRLWLRGVTYGTFAPARDGHQLGDPATVEGDLAAMAGAGINAIRTYTVPPRWVLDLAARHGIWVMVGLAWEQHVAFLDDPGRAATIQERVRTEVRDCAGHPAILAYAIGNEIPASIIRWHGRRRVERFLRTLHRAVKGEDPEALVTYVSFPSTEYLRLPFLDFVSFNVYLEDDAALTAYLARLQNLAGERPVVMAEIGLDSRRNGLDAQADALRGQIDTTFLAGCAGCFVFAWTDEWHRGGHEILDWDFGLTDRDRRPKPALQAVGAAYATAPSKLGPDAPRVSVVVCTYNGAGTLDDCLSGLSHLTYPDYEVIVVDDGSTDASAQIAARHPVRLIQTPNRGLSAARNAGLAAATGEIVAYIDDDAVPDQDWLRYVAATLQETDHVGVGGPNLPPPGDGTVAACVANAPGGPAHVLVSDRVAEHIPGCNMAFRRSWLEAINGFDPRFRVAGDDVDLCWRLQERGGTLGFHPAAQVWHHRRTTVRRFWRQQLGYGRAEALLERKWPEKYNVAGHLTWAGRLYGRGLVAGLRPSRIYYGVWGTGAFQQRVEPAPGVHALAGAPEWYLVVAGLAALSALGLLWWPLLALLPLLGGAVGLLLGHALMGAVRAEFPVADRRLSRRLGRRALTGALYLLQPAARLLGRLREGLSPWRQAKLSGLRMPRRVTKRLWFERWEPLEERLGSLEAALRGAGGRVRRGGECMRWDLEVAAGALGSMRLRAAIEEHGAGRQLMRVRLWPRVTRHVTLGTTCLVLVAIAAAVQHERTVAALLAAACGWLVACATYECARACAAVRDALTGARAGEACRPSGRALRAGVALEPDRSPTDAPDDLELDALDPAPLEQQAC